MAIAVRKKIGISLAFAVLLALCCTTQVQAQDASLIRRVDDHYNHLRTLRARYSEHYSGMGMNRSESGTLTLQKPGLMRWSYDSPTGKLFVLDGRFAWFYTPGDAQVSRAPAKQLDDMRSPLRLLLGHTQLAKELDKIATAPDGANFRISGVPKGMEQRVKSLTLIVSANGAINRMRMEETDGAITEFDFSQMEENIPLPAAEFRFTPPLGVPIVNAQPPI